MEYIIFFIMKQKTRFKKFEILVISISYWSMNGLRISIGPKETMSVNL